MILFDKTTPSEQFYNLDHALGEILLYKMIKVYLHYIRILSVPRTLVVILELGLRVPQELSRLEVVAGLDAAVEAAEEAAGAVVLGPRVPTRVALVRALVRLEGWCVGALARI